MFAPCASSSNVDNAGSPSFDWCVSNRALFVVVGDAPRANAQACAGMRLFTHEAVPLASVLLLADPCVRIHRHAVQGDMPAEGRFADVRVPAHRNAEVFAGALIGAGTEPAGMSVWLDGTWDAARFAVLDAKALGAHDDVVWVYHVDLVRKAIWLFGDGNPGTAAEGVRRGPRSVARESHPAFAACLRRIADARFTLNPSERSALVGVV